MKSDWRPFAEKLTALTKAEGQSDFLTKAFEFLNEFISVDSCAVFKIAADKTTSAEHLCTFGNLKPDLANLLAQDYISNGFRNDPMVKTALTSPHIKVRHIPGSQYPNNYRSQYFEKAGLIDKVTSIHTTHNEIFLISFYRLQSNDIFDAADFKDLQRLAPIIGGFVLRHSQLTLKNVTYNRSVDEKISLLVNDSTQVFSQLSPQERGVCEALLQGKEEAHMAKIMGISKHTVVTYRRRAYTKLNLSSKSELFKLFLIASSQ